jgi:hypothetical protein
VQAEPELTATSLMAIISPSPSTKLKLMFRLPGRRCSIEPLTYTSSSWHDAGAEPLAKGDERRALRLALLEHDLARLAEADDERHRQRARTHPALVAAAVHLRDEAHARLAAPHVEGADALGAVDLVRRERREVDVHLLDVELDLADALHRVRVEEHAALARDLADLLEGWTVPISLLASITLTRMVLSVMAFFTSSGSTRPLVDAEVGDLEALLLEALARVEDGLVLGHRRDDVVALVLVELGHTLEGEVVALGGAAREDDLFLSFAPMSAGDALARELDRLFRLPAERGCGWRRCRTSS